MNSLNSPLPVRAAVVDASVAIAMCAKEAIREALVASELLRLSKAGFSFYAPGAIVAETLFVLCHKLQNQLLTPSEHAQGVEDFETLMSMILPPPAGEASLVCRAESIRTGYSCRRLADGIYIALAEALSVQMPTVLLTFDQDLRSQAARNAPTVVIQTL